MLRLGHRLVRDERTTTHVGLVARAFGARELIITGKDDETAETIRRVSERWGGHFKVTFSENWKQVVKDWEGIVVHLTMYGKPIQQVLPKLRKKLKGEKILVVVGAEKVPGEIYQMADYNIAIGNQPHSEIAALALFLDRVYRGKELYRTYGRAKVRILPSLRGKEIEFVDESSV